MSLQPYPSIGLARFPGPGGERRFEAPSEIVQTDRLDGVRPALEQLAAATRAGKWAAGFVSYEAAGALDPDQCTHAPRAGFPLVWFGVYDSFELVDSLELVDSSQRENTESPPALRPFHLGAWKPRVGPAEYTAAIARIQALIAAGDTYQVNYTFPMQAEFSGCPEAWFEELRAAQQADHCAYIDTGRFVIASASPELFFSLEGGRIRTRPMKGTGPRGRWAAEDHALGEALKASAKDRAENVMIVDLLRNDLGRLATTGSVRVQSLFDLERYPTVWQLTSTIEAETEASWTEALATLFPSGSVTGAPKIRTMEIIRDCERHPRGVYCGAAGWAGPDGQALFNVAIRTATVDREAGSAHYAVGGGITWDSAAGAEYAECAHKARILTHRRPAFELLETMRFEEGICAYFDRHMARLRASAEYFGFAFDRERILDALLAATANQEGPLRTRLTMSPAGSVTVETRAVPPKRPFRVAWAREPVDERDVFLYHKTTHRDIYTRARDEAPDFDDSFLMNSRGEVTESCIGNVVIELGGKRYTPPVECGLLEGVFRAEKLAAGEFETRVLTREMVRKAESCWVINAVQGWIPVVEIA